MQYFMIGMPFDRDLEARGVKTMKGEGDRQFY